MKKTKLFLTSCIMGLVLCITPIQSNAKTITDYKTRYTAKEVKITKVRKDGNIHIFNKRKGHEMFTAKPVNEKVFTKDHLNLRKVPNVKSESIKVLEPKTQLKRIGITDKGWSIVEVKGKKFFVWSKHISKVRPHGKIITNISLKPRNSEYHPLYSAYEFKRDGVKYYNGWRWTWYSQNVLPGGGLNIPGRHVDSNGYICDENGYICLASNDLSKGSIVSTPFGKMGKIYDCGCPSGTIDVYVNF